MGSGEPRVGLVLGAGGVAGGAFHAGVLAALAELTGWDPRTASVVVGTSAGSVTGTTLRAGLSVTDLLARSEGRPLSEEGARLMQAVGPPPRPPSRRPPPARRPADVAAVLGRTARRPLSIRPAALIAGLVPDGTVPTEPITAAISGLFGEAWPSDPLWVCAVRRHDGRRVVFGRDRYQAPVALAVAASCAIPGYYEPVGIAGQDYIDGGVHSPTNADTLVDHHLDHGLDLVVVSSPMSQRAGALGLGAGNVVRRWAGTMLRLELRRLRRRHVPVVALEPSDRDLTAMGPNPMDPDRRAAIAAQARRSALEWLSRPALADSLAVLGTGQLR